MVAASSMVAAVEGLQSRLAGDCNMSQKMTEQLAQTIRCDPVSTRLAQVDGEVVGSALEPGWSLCSAGLLSPQDCLRACQEQIESLLETSLRQAQQHAVTTETKNVHEGQCLSATPTDVQDVNILINLHKS